MEKFFKRNWLLDKLRAEEEQEREPMSRADRLLLLGLIVSSWGIFIGIYFGISSLVSRWTQ